MKNSKLVRDKIPEIIKHSGRTPVTHIAGEEEYFQKLKEKLREEVEEFLADEDIEELADVLEVIEAMVDFKKFNKEEINSIKEKKALERGKFLKKIILDN